jgi:hypothetical protein
MSHFAPFWPLATLHIGAYSDLSNRFWKMNSRKSISRKLHSSGPMRVEDADFSAWPSRDDYFILCCCIRIRDPERRGNQCS